MARFVDMSPMAPASVLAQYLHDSTGGKVSIVEQVTQAVTAKKWGDVMDAFVPHIGATLDQPDSRSAEGAMGILVQAWQKFADESVDDEALGAAAERIVKAVSSSCRADNASSLGLQLLALAHNVAHDKPRAQMTLLRGTFQFAADTEQFEKLMGFVPQLDALMKRKDVSMQEMRGLFKIALSGIKNKDRHGMLLRLAQSYQGEDAKVLQEAEQWTTELVVMACNEPDVLQFDTYAELHTCGNIKTGKFASLHALLEVCMFEDLSALAEVEQQHGDFLRNIGVDFDSVRSKMRILSLSSLASVQSSFSFGEAAECMQVKEDDVEEWVVKAVAAGVVDAKMNQLTRSITVSRAQERVFLPGEWSQLKDRLQDWDTNLQNLLEAMERVPVA